jgi:flagella basal body P-ring formation protein FlgA
MQRHGLWITVILLAYLWGWEPVAVRAEDPESWQFRDEAQVKGNYITLGDIADLTPEQAKDFGKLIIWTAPPLGKVYTLTKDFLGYRLAQSGGPPNLPPEQLPAVIQVKRAEVRVEMTKLEELFRDYILEKSPWPTDSLQIQVYPVINLPVLPAGELTYQVMPLVNNQFLGTVAMNVLVLQEGKLVKRIYLSGKVVMSKQVVCATRNLQAGQVIAPEDAKVTKQEFSQNPSHEVFLDPTEVIGKVVAHGVGPQEAILARNLSKLPPIKRGDLVNILILNNGLSISTKGQAKEAGQVGKNITVINLASKKELQAQVVDRQTVKIEM